MSEEKKLEGIRGWLIFIALGIIVSPIRIVATTIQSFMELFKSGAWDVLTTPGTEAYHPLWAPVLIGETFLNAALFVGWLYMGYRFFTKSRAFPKWYIAIALFTLGFVIIDSWAVQMLLPEQRIFSDPDTLSELARALFMVVVWVPYMLVSKRVKATFVR